MEVGVHPLRLMFAPYGGGFDRGRGFGPYPYGVSGGKLCSEEVVMDLYADRDVLIGAPVWVALAVDSFVDWAARP